MSTRTKNKTGIKFEPGRIVSTPGALNAIERAGQDPVSSCKNTSPAIGATCQKATKK